MQEARNLEPDHEYVRQSLKWLASAEDEEAIVVVLEGFVEYLPVHFRMEEGVGGLFELILTKTPHHAGHVAQLRADHGKIMVDINRILAMIERPYGPASPMVLKSVAALGELLGRHEHREEGLLQDVLERDLGIGH